MRFILAIFLFVNLPVFAQEGEKCRQKFENSVCLQAATKRAPKRSSANKYAGAPIEAQRDLERSLRHPVCDPVNFRYVKLLMETYDHLPQHTKKVLCDVSTIFIINDPDQMGMAMNLYDTKDFEYLKKEPEHIDGHTGTFVELWPESFVLFLNEQLFKDIRWEAEYRKEGFDRRYLPEVPKEMVPYPELGKVTTLETTLIHEAGHFLASANRIGSFGLPAHWNKSYDPNWYNISFAPKDGQDWKLREGGEEILEQYRMRKPIWTEKFVPEFISFLKRGGFPTILASFNPNEDFAESYRGYINGFRHIQKGKILYSSDDADGFKWQRKRTYIEKLLTSPEVKYKASDARWVLDIIWIEDSVAPSAD